MTRPILIFAFVAMLAPLGSAVGDETDPTGTWKWRYANQSAFNTIKLKLEQGKLSGFVIRRIQGEVPIERTRYKDGKMSFNATVTSEMGDATKILVTFSGTIRGDSIKGTVETKHPDGRATTSEWIAQRVKQ